MKQVIYSPAHKGLKEYPLLKMPNVYDEKYNTTHNWFLRQDFEADFEIYNLWLSSPPIAIVPTKFIEFFSVPRGEGEYEIDYVDDGIDRNGEKKYKGVAIPIKEGNNAPNKLLLSDSLASHSCAETSLLDKKEYILCAALHVDDGEEHLHQPRNIKTGFVICGRRHHNCYRILEKIPEVSKLDVDREGQGFITNLDRYVDRKEAFQIAKAAGQCLQPDLINENIGLTSEDLY
jgi:hypothetical protein